MDQITRHKTAVGNLVKDIMPLFLPDENGIETQLIIDEERGHYLIFGVGWENINRGYFYASFVHIDVKNDGKVWLQHDGTSLKIAEQLVERGIAKNNIVIGFQSPAVRPHMDGYAIA